METYSADRTKFLELVKAWKFSSLGENLYKEPTKRIAEGDALVSAPWVNKPEEQDDNLPVRSGWYNESVGTFDGSFDDIAEVFDRDDIADMVYSLSSDDRIVEAAIKQLEENPGKILIISKNESEQAYAIQFESGDFFAAEIEADEDMLESINHLALIARTANFGKGDVRTPVIPGYVPIPLYQWNQQRMYEVLHSANIVLNSLRETESKSSFVSLLEAFTKDLSEVIAELILDNDSLTESEHDSIFDIFAGVFDGITDALQGEPDAQLEAAITNFIAARK